MGKKRASKKASPDGKDGKPDASEDFSLVETPRVPVAETSNEQGQAAPAKPSTAKQPQKEGKKGPAPAMQPPKTETEKPAPAGEPVEPEHVDMKRIIEEEVATTRKTGEKDPALEAIDKELGLHDPDAVVSAPDLLASMRAQEEKPREAWKILFSGLDFAGKSSILATIKHEFQKIVNPQPTKFTERSSFSFLGQQIAEWDLGGQRLYRIQYLKRPLVYYADTSVLFYVIDTMDEERYEEAIDFLYDSLQVFDKLNINPLISILFHKFDPDVEKDSKTTRIELKLTALTNKIKVITYGRDVLFFRTSIFNRFSVIEAFSRSMLELFPDKNLVDYVLAELATKTNANIIILLDENRFILGQNIVETGDRQYEELVSLAQNTLLSFLYLDENFNFYPFLQSSYMIIQLERFSFLWTRVMQDGHPFYIIVFKEGANFDDLLAMDMSAVGKTLIQLVKR